MPPKKDDKKKKGEGTTVREVDPSWYIRKPISLPEINDERQFALPNISGKVINVETIFPEWSDAESWGEAIPPERLPQIQYPVTLDVDKVVNFTTFYELDLVEGGADPKAKGKKEAKKPAKGKVEEVVEMTELLVNDNGRPLPVMYRDDGNEGFKFFPEIKPFAQREISKNEGSTSILDDVDPFLCETFRTISIFCPIIVQDSNHHHLLERNDKLRSLNENYLWRSIYPKLPNGKPCYNPSGKYCVKVYLAGKWRKIYVDDTIPLKADGTPAIAFSKDKYELWPLILAKAVYTVYSACGYSFADEFATALSRKSVNLSLPLLASQFVAFSIHILTGWQHHQSVDAANLFSFEKSKSVRFLNYMATAGVPLINSHDIISDDPSYSFNSDSSSEIPTGDVTTEESQDLEVMKTKRRFKEEYTKRKEIRNEIVKKVIDRENKVNRITSILQQGSVEIFFAVRFDHALERYRVNPILGVAYPNNEHPNHHNINQVSFLLDWVKSDPVSITPNVEDPIILGKGKIPVPEFLEPFPLSSPVKSLWNTADELIEENAFITALFTSFDTPYSTDCAKHWISSNPEPVAADPKAKDKKGKDKNAPAAAPVDETFADSGSFQPTFITVDTTDLYAEMEAELQNSGPSSNVDNEVQEALMGQASELENYQQRPNSGQNSDSGLVLINNDHTSSTTKKWNIKLVVTIIADMTKDVKTNSTSPNSPEALFRMNSNIRGSWDESSLPQNKILPSDTMLVLQEVRNDDHEPLMFVMQLKDTAHLPMVSKPFSIPFDRLSSKGPLVFWLRLFTKSSVYVNISSNVKVHTDLAEKIWKESLGYHALVREGDAGVTVDETEQLLFRVPLDFEVKENDVAPVGVAECSNNDNIDAVNKEGLVTSRSDQSLVPRVIVYLFVSDPAIERLLHVLLVSTRKSDQSADMMEIPNPLGLIIPITSLKGFINNLIAFTVSPKDVQIPKFHWKLVILSKEALLEPQKPVLEYPISQRYSGKYIANNKLRLFRDVYSVEKTSFPLALKLSVSNIDETNLSHNAIILRAFKKSDGNLIAEFDANDIIHCYYLDVLHLLGEQDDQVAATAAKVDPKAAKGGGGKGGKGAAPTVETVDIVLECVLDPTHMRIPESYTSRFPHVFDSFFSSNEDDASPGVVAQRETLRYQVSYLALQPPEQPLLNWTIDFLSGKIANVSHDVSPLVAFTETKKTWEDSIGGRIDRAIASASYIREREELKKAHAQAQSEAINKISTQESVEFTPTMMESLSQALAADVEEVKNRFSTLHKVAKIEEKVEVVPTAPEESLIYPHNPLRKLGSEAWGEAVSSRRKAEREKLEEYYQRLLQKSMELNQVYRENCKERVNKLSSSYLSQREELLNVWVQREKYRVEIEAKNSSLNFLLTRAQTARKTVKEQEVKAEEERLKQEAKNAKGKKK